MRLDLLCNEAIEPEPTRSAPPPAAPPESQFPDYDILAVLGRGGMGVVYRARQKQLNREVALKSLVHLGLTAPNARARFQSEIELLARLQHPNIVQIYQAGVHDGTPYLAMEYVAGGTLDQHLEQGLPTVRRAAELVETVARAVHFAHEHSVLHRDLKPGNILLTADGQPKVADFGLARDLGTGSHLTRTGEAVGTPAYMAPEQLQSAKALTAAADVYALGVLLHRVLTGAVPFVGDSLPMVLLQVLSREPLPLQTWQPTLPRDLDTICRKCLNKNPVRRYQTAGELADDLRRFLDGRPVVARPVSRWEKCARWCYRHSTVAGLSAALVVVVLLAIGGLIWGVLAQADLNRHLETANASLTESNRALEDARQTAEVRRREAETARTQSEAERQRAERQHHDAQKARTQAETERKRAEQTVEFLVTAFRRPDPYQDGKKLTVFDLSGKAWRDLATQEALDPPTRLALLRAIARTYRGLGEDGEAVKVLEPARRIATASLSFDHPDSLSTHQDLAAAYRAAGRYKDAIALYEQVRDARLKQNGPEHPDTLTTMNNLAGAYQSAKRYGEALALYERLRDQRVAALGPDHPTTLIAINNLAAAYLAADRKTEAVELFERVHNKQAEKLGLDDPNTLTTLNNLAVAYRGVGRTADAIPLYERVRDLRLKKLGLGHPNTLLTLHDLAAAYVAAARYADAVATYEQVRDERMKKPGPEHWNTLHTLNDLATAYRRAGRTADAITGHSRVLEVRLRVIGPDHVHTLLTRSELAADFQAAGRTADAVTHLEPVYAARLKALGFDHPDTDGIFRQLVPAYEKLGRFDRQEVLLRDSHHQRVQKDGAKSPAAAASGAHLGACLLRQQKYTDAEPFLREALSTQEEQQADVWGTFRTRSLFGASFMGQHRHAEAEPLLRDGYRGLKERAERIPEAGRAVTLRAAAERLVELYRATGQTGEAAHWQKERELWSPSPKPK